MDLIPVTSEAPLLPSSPRVEELVAQFLAAQDIKPVSRGLYRRTLKQYFAWVERKGYLLSGIARPQLLEYKDELLASGLSSLTVCSYITSVRRFYEWAEAERYYPNVARGIKSPRRAQAFRKQALTVKEARRLLSYFKERSPRDLAMVNLLLRTGLRTVELTRANVGDVTYKGGKRVLLVQGKGRDERDNFVILEEKAYQPLQAYLSTRGKLPPEAPLFQSESHNGQGERLTTRSVSFIAKEGLKAIGLNDKAYSAHSLRHTVAVNILRAGGTLEMAQFTLRHSNPATTQIYTATLTEERRLKHSGEALITGLF